MSTLFENSYRGKRVLVTGDTGFKGAWLCEWLLRLGADVTGYALEAPSDPNLFGQLRLADRLRHHHADIRSLPTLQALVASFRPQFVFHLAAQTLVGPSYEDPTYTFETNVMGTVNVLEAVRRSNHSCAVVVVTSDKVYENREWELGYREDDRFGGYDPYSASKGCCEIVVSSYRRSFFGTDGHGNLPAIGIASARGGNVIGGGDWARDRIVPDCMRALSAGVPIPVRNRIATRPWQHVLEPLGGYLLLAARIAAATAAGAAGQAQLRRLCDGFNFGPTVQSNKSVAELVTAVLRHWPGEWVDRSDPNAPHEASKLNLTSDKAYHHLGWYPVWGFEETLQRTVSWYRRGVESGADPQVIRSITTSQIDEFSQSLCERLGGSAGDL